MQYELVRSSSIIRKQDALLKSLALPGLSNESIEDTLGHLLSVTEYYTGKIGERGDGIGNPQDVMKIVADEIELNGIYNAKEIRITPV